MNRLQAVARLDALIQGQWNSIEQIKASRRQGISKAAKASWISQHKLDIEALQLAREALKNPGYHGKGVALEVGADDN